MQYTHKKRLGLIRAIYFTLFILSFVAMNFGEGFVKTSLTVLSILSIVASVYLFARFEMTTFTYIIKENGTDFDFYVHKAVGRRGDYVCYYYMSDVCETVPYSKEALDELNKKYSPKGTYGFYHGYKGNDKYIVAFKNTDYYDLIILEMNEEFLSYFEKCQQSADPSSRPTEAEEVGEGNCNMEGPVDYEATVSEEAPENTEITEE